MRGFKRFGKIASQTRHLVESAFTLVELVVVITVLAILATIGFLALSGYSQDAKDSAIKANVRSVQTAISSEAALTNNSPRYYVVHDTGAALSWAVAYVDGNPTALTGGNWNASGTNYSAGNPDYVKLKMNPEKFKVSASWLFWTMAGIVWFGSVGAAYDAKYLTVGAMDARPAATSGGKARSVSYFQVAAIAPATGAAVVSWNYPASSGSVAGLVRDPGSSSSTGALTDGSVSGTNNQTIANSECQTAPVNHTQTASCGTYYDTVSLWNSKPIGWAICQDETSRGWTVIRYKKISNTALVSGTSASAYMEVSYLNASGTWVNMTSSVTNVQTEYPQFYTNKNFGYTHMGHPCCHMGIIGTSGTEVVNENCTLGGNKFRWW